MSVFILLVVAVLCFDLIETGLDAFELSFGLAVRKVAQVVVLRRDLEQPLGLDVQHGANVVLGGQDELVVDDPLGFVIEASARVELHDLIVFHSQVVACALQMCDLKFNLKIKYWVILNLRWSFDKIIKKSEFNCNQFYREDKNCSFSTT